MEKITMRKVYTELSKDINKQGEQMDRLIKIISKLSRIVKDVQAKVDGPMHDKIEAIEKYIEGSK